MSLSLTPEQQEAVTLFRTTEGGLVVRAGAGTGKTTLLVAMAKAMPSQKGMYTAFNKAIVEEAKRKMPDSCSVRTIHSLAYREAGAPMRHRLNGKRISSSQTARLLGVDPFSIVGPDGKTKVLQPGFLASLVMKAITTFCYSDALRPSRVHVPFVRGIDPDGSYANNDAVSVEVEQYLAAAWADLCKRDGKLRFAHDHYLKQWALGDCRLSVDYLMIDEAQDLNPVMLQIMAKQECRVILVGDSAQAIYGWRGAVDALDRTGATHEAALTQSFRFGPAVAEVANLCLEKVPGSLRLVGFDAIPSVIDHLDSWDCLLTRSNARGIEELLECQRSGVAAHIMGGATELLAFARAAADLMEGKSTSYADLACFDSWDAVLAFVANDPQGDELALNVRLVEKYGALTIIKAIRDMPSEADAEVTISTAHKAKGREWDRVKLADDFRYPKADPEKDTKVELGAEEWRLLYVAVTRAKLALDPFAAEPVADLLPKEDEAAAPAAPALTLIEGEAS